LSSSYLEPDDAQGRDAGGIGVAALNDRTIPATTARSEIRLALGVNELSNRQSEMSKKTHAARLASRLSTEREKMRISAAASPTFQTSRHCNRCAVKMELVSPISREIRPDSASLGGLARVLRRAMFGD
jgi:hypothetical protein